MSVNIDDDAGVPERKTGQVESLLCHCARGGSTPLARTMWKGAGMAKQVETIMHKGKLYMSVEELIEFLEQDVNHASQKTAKAYVKKLTTSLEKSKEKVLKEDKK